MATSQNGWRVDDTGERQDRSALVPGVTAPNGVLKGDVATVLHYVARRFDAEVERLKPGQCWGWFVKGIEGSQDVSNHASGTAIDLNAPDHPIGHAGTFTLRQVVAIDKILAACDGVVRWGGHYAGRKDEMHFEIVKSLSAVSALAEKITIPKPAEGSTAVTVTKTDVATILNTDDIIPNPDFRHDSVKNGGTNQFIALRTAVGVAMEEAHGANSGVALLAAAVKAGLDANGVGMHALAAEIHALTQDPADLPDPEAHPLVRAVRYVLTHAG